MSESKGSDIDRPNTPWNRVYIAVVINTIIVIALLYAFTQYFSN